jgi:hypothetical protein
MIVGIDYSMTSPALCVCVGEFDIKNCKFLYVTNVKKYEGVFGQFEGVLVDSWKHNADRFDQLAGIARDFIFNNWPEDSPEPLIGLEGYAMGAKGQVFNIGENTGILKYYIQVLEEWEVATYAPSSIKKFATEKGNADKEKMYESFILDTGLDLEKVFGFDIDPEKIRGPISDVVDAYYIAKLHSQAVSLIES